MDEASIRPYIGSKAWFDPDTGSLVIRDSSDAVLQEVRPHGVRLEFWGAAAALRQMVGRPTSDWVSLGAIRAIRDIRTRRPEPPAPAHPARPDAGAERRRASGAMATVRTVAEAERLIAEAGDDPYGQHIRASAASLVAARPLLLEPGAAFTEQAWRGEWPGVSNQEAVARLTEVLRSYPRLDSARLAWILACRRAGRTEEGIATAKALLEDLPDAPGVRTELAVLFKGDERLGDALDWLDAELARGTGDWQTHYYRAQALAQRVQIRAGFAPGADAVGVLRALALEAQAEAIRAQQAAPPERAETAATVVGFTEALTSLLDEAAAAAAVPRGGPAPARIDPVNGPAHWSTTLGRLDGRSLTPPGEAIALTAGWWHDQAHLLQPWYAALSDIPLHTPWPVRSYALRGLRPGRDRVHISFFLFASDQPAQSEEAIAVLIVEGRGSGWIDRAWVDALSLQELQEPHFVAIREATRRVWPTGDPPPQLLGVLNSRAITENVDMEHWAGVGAAQIHCPRPLAAVCLVASDEQATPPWLLIELFEAEEPRGERPLRGVVYDRGDAVAKRFDLDLGGSPPASSGPLAPLVGRSCAQTGDSLTFAKGAPAVLEYASPRWVWLSLPVVGLRRAVRLNTLRTLPGAPASVRWQVERRPPPSWVAGSALVALLVLGGLVLAAADNAPPVATPPPVIATIQPPPPPPEEVTLGQKCTLRTSASSKSKSAGKVAAGNVCTVLERDGDWVNVHCQIVSGWLTRGCLK